MRGTSPDLERLLARAKLELLPEDYYVVRLPPDTKTIPGEWYRPATTRFAVFIRTSKGITLVVSRRKWLRMQNLFESFDLSEPMRVITLDVDLPLRPAGYMATLAEPLAAAHIAMLPVAGYDRDQFLVRKRDLPRAVRVLRQFLAECRK